MRSTLPYKQQVVLAGALALVAVCLSVVLAHAEPEKKTDVKPAPKKLTGAELYAVNCARGVERKLKATPGVASATVDLAAARADVEFDPARTNAESLAAAVRQLGYEASA